MKWRSTVWLFAWVWILGGCTESYEYQAYTEIEDDLWHETDSVVFEFNSRDTSTLYSLLLEIDHTQEYAYQNLYVKIVTKFPSGREVSDLTNFNLGDHTGSWYGDCRMAKCKATANLQSGFRFEDTGRHEIVIFPYMRKYPIRGIEGFGLILDALDE